MRYAAVPAIAEANDIRRIAIPGQYTKYHKGDVLDLAAASTIGTGRVGATRNDRIETGGDRRQVLAGETTAAPSQRPTEAEVLTP